VITTTNRVRLPATREGITHRFVIKTTDSEVTGFIIANTYENGNLAEVFCRIDREGSTIGGMMDAVTILISLALQHGVPLKCICDKLSYMRFDPSGLVTAGDPEIHQAQSLTDYLSRWLAKQFLLPEDQP